MKPMTGNAIHPGPSRHPVQSHPAIWIVLIVSCGVFLSATFACVTPFAALATLAALKLDRRGGLLVLTSVWLANQAIGYGLLGYPWTWDSLAWGATIGLSAGLAMVAAFGLSAARPAPMAVSLPFVAAFTTFELTLYLAGFILPGSDAAFTPAIISHIFLINAATLCTLMIVYYLTILLRRQARLSTLAPTAASASR